MVNNFSCFCKTMVNVTYDLVRFWKFIIQIESLYVSHKCLYIQVREFHVPRYIFFPVGKNSIFFLSANPPSLTKQKSLAHSNYHIQPRISRGLGLGSRPLFLHHSEFSRCKLGAAHLDHLQKGNFSVKIIFFSEMQLFVVILHPKVL